MLFEGEEALAAARAADEAAGRAPPGPDGAAAVQAGAPRRKRQDFLARRGIDDPMGRCLLTGVPRIQYRPLPLEMIQLPDRVIMLYEIHHAFRIIPTDGRGASRGRRSRRTSAIRLRTGTATRSSSTSRGSTTRPGSRASARSTASSCA